MDELAYDYEVDHDLEDAKYAAAKEEAEEREEYIEENDVYCPRCLDTGCFYCEP